MTYRDSQREIWRLKIPLTQSCNLDCAYCYVRKKKKEIQPAFYQRVLKKFFNTPGDKKEVVILGGEPLLFPDRLGKLIEFIKREKRKKITISLCTNLSFKKNTLPAGVDFVFVSLDGKQISHDKGRVFARPFNNGSFNQVIKNINALTDKKEKKKLRITKIITPQNVEFLLTDFIFLKNLNLPFNFSPAAGISGWDKKKLATLRGNLTKIFQIIKKEIKENDKEVPENLKVLFFIPPAFCPFSSLMLGTDGCLYNCEFLALGDFKSRALSLKKLTSQKCVYDLTKKRCREEKCLQCGLVCLNNILPTNKKLGKDAIFWLRQVQQQRNFLLVNFVREYKIKLPHQIILLNYRSDRANDAANFIFWMRKFVPVLPGRKLLFVFYAVGQKERKIPEKIFASYKQAGLGRFDYSRPTLVFDCRDQEVYFLSQNSGLLKLGKRKIETLIKNKSIGNLKTGIGIASFIL